MKFLRNAWYAAGWADEIGPEDLVGRTILNEPVLLFRQSDGTAKAIQDRCPHRFAPLHMGRHIGDGVQCGYHGLEFDGQGVCTFNPFADEDSADYPARVRTFPMVEKHTVLWIWMGDEAPDHDAIPDTVGYMEDTSRKEMHGHIHVAANYSLLNDNLMDLSHAIFLHQGSLANKDMIKSFRPEVRHEASRVYCQRKSPDVVPPRLWHPGLGDGVEKVDFFSHLQWDAPSSVLLEVGCTPLGQPFRSEGEITGLNSHLFTPETEFTSHYFWSFSRDFSPEDAAVDEHVRDVALRAFVEEDKPMLEAQQKMIGEEEIMSLKPMLLRTDNAAMRVRRILGKMIAEEEKAAEAATVDA